MEMVFCAAHIHFSKVVDVAGFHDTKALQSVSMGSHRLIVERAKVSEMS